MNCRKVREVTFLYTDNEAGDELRISIREHLELCPECAAQIERARQLLALLRERTRRMPAPERLRRRILVSFPHRRR